MYVYAPVVIEMSDSLLKKKNLVIHTLSCMHVCMCRGKVNVVRCRRYGFGTSALTQAVDVII